MKLPRSLTLKELLPPAQQNGYAVAAFNARYRACVRPVLEAALELHSPVILEISQRELGWFGLTPQDFRDAVERAVRALGAQVPLCLHLDHSWDFGVIRQAITAGFGSVMIDASAQPFDENLRQTRQVVAFAHAHGVSVEAELGRLGTSDDLETEGDESLYTVPQEALTFVEHSGCDVLAVSVGTAHGVYPVSHPTIDFARLAAIRALLPDTPLVLHGGSGLPAETVQRAIALPGGGISKMNVATDLENALLAGLGGLSRMTSAQLDALEPGLLARGLAAVKARAADKMQHFVRSAGRADQFVPSDS